MQRLNLTMQRMTSLFKHKYKDYHCRIIRKERVGKVEVYYLEMVRGDETTPRHFKQTKFNFKIEWDEIT